MTHAQQMHKTFMSFGNPFRVRSSRGSQMPQKFVSLLDSFEESLDRRIRELKPERREDVLPLSWMTLAMRSLCEVYSDAIKLMTALELPVSDWDDNWVEVYLNNSVKLLDICNAFTSEISRLKQSHLFLKCALHNLDGGFQKHVQACSSLEAWRKQINKKNPRLEDCFNIMDALVFMLDLPKVKNSTKGKVLMRAMYGVKVLAVAICNIFAVALSASPSKLIDLQVSHTYLWSVAFTDLQNFLNLEIRNSYLGGIATVLKELEAVDGGVKKIHSVLKNESNFSKDEALPILTSELRESSEKFSRELHQLNEEVDGFFKVVLEGRDTLLMSTFGVSDILCNKAGSINRKNTLMAR